MLNMPAGSVYASAPRGAAVRTSRITSASTTASPISRSEVRKIVITNLRPTDRPNGSADHSK